MANVNKVILIGHMTRDPEFRSFGSGGRLAAFGFAVTNRKKNPQTGQWEDDPMFIECTVFNGENYKQADRVEQFGLRKGSHLFIEGKLVLDRWDDKTTGEKRSKHKIIVDSFQSLERRDGGQSGSMGGSAPRAAAPRASAQPADDYHGSNGYDEGPPASGGGDGDIPF